MWRKNYLQKCKDRISVVIKQIKIIEFRLLQIIAEELMREDHKWLESHQIRAALFQVWHLVSAVKISMIATWYYLEALLQNMTSTR